MQTSRYKITAALILALAGNALGTGTRANFLSHGPSVADFARGETGAASLDNIPSAYFNPSLISRSLQHYSGAVSFSHFALVSGSMYDYLSYYRPIKNIAAKFSIIDLRSGDIDLRQTIADSPKTVQTSQWAFMLSAAKHLDSLSGIDVGVNLKYILEDLYAKSGTGVGMDIGASKEFSGPKLFGNYSRIDAGVSALNVVPPRLTLDTAQEVFEPSYRVGGALSVPVVYRLRTIDTAAIYMDLVQQESLLTIQTGVQYCVADDYFLRVGYFADHFTAGVGVHVQDFIIDYAMDFNSLELIHRFGATYFWNIKSPDKVVEKTRRTRRSKDPLMIEARQSLRDEKHRKAALDKIVRPLFRKARKLYSKQQFLAASDQFRDIILQYPEYEISKIYYDKINEEMNENAKKENDYFFETASYAKGFLDYRNQDFSAALNEWDRVLQVDSNRQELIEYISKVKEHLKDIERIALEKARAQKVESAFSLGLQDFNNAQWVPCIKKMEHVKELCKQEPFPASLEWYNRAQEYIEKSLHELSLELGRPSERKQISKENNAPLAPEIDATGADKKYTEGLILYAQGKISDAIRVWEICIRLNPNHEKAHKAIIRAREELEARVQ